MANVVTEGSIAPHYEVVAEWGKLPDGWSFIEVAGVAVDSRDHRNRRSRHATAPKRYS